MRLRWENSWIASVGAEDLVDEGDEIGNGFTVSVSSVFGVRACSGCEGDELPE
ncbi:hypothetical protein OROHE_007614 [Orobanche hederae]